MKTFTITWIILATFQVYSWVGGELNLAGIVGNFAGQTLGSLGAKANKGFSTEWVKMLPASHPYQDL